MSTEKIRLILNRSETTICGSEVHYPSLLSIKDRNADIVLASAYHPEGTVENVPLLRLIISRVGNRILSKAFKDIGKYHTWTCIVRAFRSSVVKSMDLVSYGKELHLEILEKASLLGFTITEIPAELRWREGKRQNAEDKRENKRRKTSKNFFAKTSKSHVASSFIFRPGSLFYIPLSLLFIIWLYTSITIGIQIFFNIFYGEEALSVLRTIVVAVRNAYARGAASFYVAGISLITLFQLLIFYLISRQINKYYVDIYSFLNKQCNRCLLGEKKASVGGESLSGKIGNE